MRRDGERGVAGAEGIWTLAEATESPVVLKREGGNRNLPPGSRVPAPAPGLGALAREASRAVMRLVGPHLCQPSMLPRRRSFLSGTLPPALPPGDGRGEPGAAQ